MAASMSAPVERRTARPLRGAPRQEGSTCAEMGRSGPVGREGVWTHCRCCPQYLCYCSLAISSRGAIRTCLLDFCSSSAILLNVCGEPARRHRSSLRYSLTLQDGTDRAYHFTSLGELLSSPSNPATDPKQAIHKHATLSDTSDLRPLGPAVHVDEGGLLADLELGQHGALALAGEGESRIERLLDGALERCGAERVSAPVHQYRCTITSAHYSSC